MSQPLLRTFDELIGNWREVFSQNRIFERARRLTFGMLVSLRLHLTSNAICATGRQFEDWSADYRVCSQSPWDAEKLFDPVMETLPEFLSSPQAPILVALDDSLYKKTGKKIPGVTMGRDPMSPPFHVNLCYGVRFVQASLLVTPHQGGAARALPVRFEFAPPAVKPKGSCRPKAEAAKGIPEAEQKKSEAERAHPADSQKTRKASPTTEEIAYQEEKKLRRLPQVGLNVLISIREDMDRRPQLRDRVLLATGDASYTTRLVLRGLPEHTVYIGRIRKNAKLHLPLAATDCKTKGRPRRYGEVAATPEQMLQDQSIPWQKLTCFAAGEWREVQVKVAGPVYWRNAGVDLPVQVVVIKAPGYRLRKGKISYRSPAFLICTDPTLPLTTLVQTYIYRWEIECNHRDEKSLLGVAQGQVRNPQAVRRLPQLQVAGYSLLLLAALRTSGFLRHQGDYLPLPKWRCVTETTRPSVLDLINLLREQIFARSLTEPLINFTPFTEEVIEPVKSSKLPLAADTLSTLAA